MLKRKENDDNLEDIPLIKSLRRSISKYIDGNIPEEDPRKSIDNDKALEQLQSRLSTFTILKWKGKSNELSPLKCAQFGWTCINSEFLQCSKCKKIINVNIPPLSKISIQVYNACIRKCLRQLAESHDIACSFRFAETSSTLFAYNILERFKKLSLFNIKIPLVPISQLDISEEDFNNFEIDKHQALIMAIFGWQFKDSNPEQFFCSACGRKFNAKVFSEEMPINPIDQHYWYCPIIDKHQPFWKELYQQQIKTKETNKSIAVKLTVIKSTLFDALVNNKDE